MAICTARAIFEPMDVTRMNNTPYFRVYMVIIYPKPQRWQQSKASLALLSMYICWPIQWGGLTKKRPYLPLCLRSQQSFPTLLRSQRSRENKPAANVKQTALLSGRFTMISTAPLSASSAFSTNHARSVSELSGIKWRLVYMSVLVRHKLHLSYVSIYIWLVTLLSRETGRPSRAGAAD